MTYIHLAHLTQAKFLKRPLVTNLWCVPNALLLGSRPVNRFETICFPAAAASACYWRPLNYLVSH